MTCSDAFQPVKPELLSAICATNWDVIIAGGGPASSAAASKLAQMGWQVLVLEHQPERSGYGESLPPFSVNLVRDLLGITSESDYKQAGMRALPGNQSAWVNEQPAIFDFCTHPSRHGLCVERQQFDHALRQRATVAGAQYFLGAKFTHCEPHPQHGWRVEVQFAGVSNSATFSTVQLNTRYVADATGRRASVARAIGITAQRTDKLCAVLQLYRSNTPSCEADFTLLEAAENGWWYSNLLPDGQHRVVAFHCDRDLSAARQASNNDGFNSLLEKTRHISAVLRQKPFTKWGALRVTSACSQRLSSFVANGFVAIGDAAQAYDPLSSQGMAKALETGVKAGQLIGYALESAAEPHMATRYLTRYATAQESLWQRYQQQYQYFYQTQPRWPNAEFWQRRCKNHDFANYQRVQHAF